MATAAAAAVVAYYGIYRQRANATNTMFPNRQTHAVLRGTLQEPGGGAGFATSVGSVVPPAIPRSRSRSGIVACEGGGGAGSAGALAGDDAESDGEMVNIGGGGDVEVSPEPRAKTKPRGAPRAP